MVPKLPVDLFMKVLLVCIVLVLVSVIGPGSAESISGPGGERALDLASGEGLHLSLTGFYGEGSIDAIAVKCGIVYRGNGEYLDVTDMTDPLNPVHLDRQHLGDRITDLAISGDYIFVSVEEIGLSIFDIVDPSSLVQAGALPYNDCRKLAVHETICYLLGSEDLYVIDILDPDNPSQVAATGFTGDATDISVYGTRIYISSGYYLRVFDITEPSLPIAAGEWSSSGTLHAVYADDSAVYVAAGDDEIVVLDATFPTDIKVHATYGPSCSNQERMEIGSFGEYLFIGCGSAFEIVDVSDPALPFQEEFSGTADAVDFALSGARIFTAQEEGRIGIVDFTQEPYFNNTRVLSSGGQSQEAAVENDTVYIAAGDSGLVIWDTSSSPVRLGQFDTPYFSRGVAYDGQVAYLAEGTDGVSVIDVSDPSSPSEIARYRVEAWSVSVRRNILYIASGGGGLHIADISDPSSPGEISTLDTPGSARDLFLYNRLALVADDTQGLRVIDVSDPFAPVETGSCYTPIPVRSVAASGHMAFLGTFGIGGAYLIDMSDPADPANVGFINEVYLDMHTYVHAVEHLLIISGIDNRLRMYDTSCPSAPIRIEDFSTADTMRAVCVEADQVYVPASTGGVMKFDLFPGPMFTHINQDFGKRSLADAEITGDLAVCISPSGNAVEVIDISIPAAPDFVSAFEQIYLRDIDAVGDFVFAACGTYGFHIWDLTDSENPVECPMYRPANFEPTDVEVIGDYAYVAERSGMRILDISDPYDVVPMGEYSVATSNGEARIEVEGDYAYLGFGGLPGYLVCLDVSDPHALIPVDLTTMGVVRDLCFEGDHLFVATTGGISILDLAVPYDLLPSIGFLAMEAYDIAVSGGLAYVASGLDGVRLLNVSDPTDPAEVGYYDTFGDCLGVTMFGTDHCVVLDSDNGLKIVGSDLLEVMVAQIAAVVDEGRISVRWELSEDVPAGEITVARQVELSGRYDRLKTAAVKKEGRRYFFSDEDVDPGSSYSYLVGVESDEEAYTLFETETLEISPMPLTLMSCHPNPFNPSTTLRFYVPAASRVIADVYNVEGKRVSRVFDEIQQPGLKTVVWDGKDSGGDNLSTGVYFLTIRAGKEMVTEKLILLR